MTSALLFRRSADTTLLPRARNALQHQGLQGEKKIQGRALRMWIHPRSTMPARHQAHPGLGPQRGVSAAGSAPPAPASCLGTGTRCQAKPRVLCLPLLKAELQHSRACRAITSAQPRRRFEQMMCCKVSAHASPWNHHLSSREVLQETRAEQPWPSTTCFATKAA